MKAKALEAGQQKPGMGNAIQLTIKYPGMEISTGYDGFVFRRGSK